MMKIIYLVFISIIFTSCTGIKEVFSKDYMYETVLENTRKSELVESLETKVSITATYLNNIEVEIDKSKENFLISLFISNDFKENYALKNPFVNIFLNQKKLTSFKEIKKDSKLLKTIDILNPWAKYFLVTFKYQNQNDLNLSVNYKKLSTTMEFTK